MLEIHMQGPNGEPVKASDLTPEGVDDALAAAILAATVRMAEYDAAARTGYMLSVLHQVEGMMARRMPIDCIAALMLVREWITHAGDLKAMGACMRARLGDDDTCGAKH